MNSEQGKHVFREALATALLHQPAKAVALAIGANPAEVLCWAKGREAGTGVFIAMCHVAGDFGLVMRSAVRPGRSRMKAEQVIESMVRATDSLFRAKDLLKPVASVTPAPRAGRPQVAGALARVEEAIEELEAVASSLRGLAETRRQAAAAG